MLINYECGCRTERLATGALISVTLCQDHRKDPQVFEAMGRLKSVLDDAHERFSPGNAKQRRG